MRAKLQETERLAGIRPPGRPAREAPPAAEETTPETAQDLAALSTQAARANQALRWILEGASEYDILEAMQQAWPCADHAAILLAAVDQIRDASRMDRTVVAGFCAEATRDLYRRMVEIGDFAGALRAIRQLRELTK
jgi:hypothetical protein